MPMPMRGAPPPPPLTCAAPPLPTTRGAWPPGGFWAKLAVGTAIGKTRAIAATVLKTLGLIMVGSIRGDTAQLFGQADVPGRAQIVRGMEPRLSSRSCTRNEQIARSPRQIATEKRLPCRFTDGSLIAGLNWTICRADGIRVAALLEPAPMKLFLLKLFTWWNGQTFGTQLWTWRFGELVGEDEEGNRYFRTKGRKIDPSLGFERRWGVYNGYAEATRVPPSWHGWLHHTVDIAPTEETYQPHEWEKPHIPNMTGTPLAYRPSGSTLASGRRPAATGDYQPWTPGN